ncbi:MAG: ATPase [Bacteroidota bacterium]
MEAQVGKTKDVGYQFGIQKTFLISAKQAWDFMFSDDGLKIWLGELQTDFSLRENYRTKSGIAGFVRIFEPYSHIRMNWKKKHWENISTVQLRVIGKNDNKTTISFHQEKLLDSNQRLEMQVFWHKKMECLTGEIRKGVWCTN